jgi:hypothetical protein
VEKSPRLIAVRPGGGKLAGPGRHAGRIAFGTAIVLTTAAIASSCWRYGWYRGVYVTQRVCD